MKILSGYVIAAIWLVTVIVLTGTASSDEGDKGKTLYESRCMICHGIKGDGNGSAAAYLSLNPADFTNPKFWENHNDKQIEDIIVNGKGQMPTFDLTPEELKAVVAYIMQAFKPLNK
jgi:mono/diheme cytochrome c family protein